MLPNTNLLIIHNVDILRPEAEHYIVRAKDGVPSVFGKGKTLEAARESFVRQTRGAL